MSRPAPWWRPDHFAARAPKLALRSAIKSAIRHHFHKNGFTEVDAPALQVSPGNETHICAFATQMTGPDGVPGRMFLHASPEFACKKLLAAGVARLYSLGPVYRNRERGRLHHPEFHMLEWYRSGGTLADLMHDAGRVLWVTAASAGTTDFRHGETHCEAIAEPELLSVVEAFRRHAGLDLAAMLPETADATPRLAGAARGLGLRVAADDTWSDLFSKVVSARIEPQLGLGRPTFLTRYPASEAALARLCDDDPRFAERFELYVCGVELANAFAELRDPIEQRARFAAAEAERLRIYGESYPIDEDFLDALAIMPDAAGIALGFDRLVMLATGAARIEDVLWAPVAETGT